MIQLTDLIADDEGFYDAPESPESPESSAQYFNFGREAFKKHDFRLQKLLHTPNPEDSMEGANLFDEPIEPSTQVTTNNQNDPTYLIADDEGFYDAEENVDLKYVKNMGHQIEKRQNNNNVLTYTITPRPEFEYTTSCNNQVTHWPNLFVCNIQVPMFLGINESTNLIHGLICDTTSNPQRIVYTLYPEEDSSKLLETSYYWIAAEHFNGQDCNPVGFSHTSLSHNATTILSLCKPIKDYCHPPLPIPSPTETPNSTA